MSHRQITPPILHRSGATAARMQRGRLGKAVHCSLCASVSLSRILRDWPVLAQPVPLPGKAKDGHAPRARTGPPGARRLDFLHLQCRAWTGRAVAAVYVALAAGANTTVSWDPRFAGRPLLAVRQALSRFYDALDPTSAPPHLCTLFWLQGSRLGSWAFTVQCAGPRCCASLCTLFYGPALLSRFSATRWTPPCPSMCTLLWLWHAVMT